VSNQSLPLALHTSMLSDFQKDTLVQITPVKKNFVWFCPFKSVAFTNEDCNKKVKAAFSYYLHPPIKYIVY